MKHTPYYNLLDAIKEKGCPICFLVVKNTHKFMDDFLYESVNDPGLRKEIRESYGFCNRHAWQLQKFGDGFGVSIVYKDLAQLIDKKLGKINNLPALIKDLNKSRKLKNNCMFCKQERDVENRYASVFIENFMDPELKHHYKNSFGFCIPHLLTTINKFKNRKAIEEITAIESEKISGLIAELSEFQRKHDYRFSKEGFGKEGDSWIRAIEKLEGKEGVF
jgi:hypothetical protein